MRIPMYRWGSSSGPAVGLTIGGMFAGIAAYASLFHTTGEPVSWVLFGAMVALATATGLTIGLLLRRRARRPLAFIRIDGDDVELRDPRDRFVVRTPLSELRAAEGWHVRGTMHSRTPFYTLAIDLGGRWAITALGPAVVERDLCRPENHFAPNAAVTDLDYLRLRRALLPERAAQLSGHMVEREAFLRAHGIGERHPSV